MMLPLSRSKSSWFVLSTVAAIGSWALVFSCGDDSAGSSGLSFDAGGFDVGSVSPAEGGPSVGTTDGGPDAADAAEAGSLFTVDAGSDCHPITSQETLSAAGAGLPADGLSLWLRADRGVYGASTEAGAPAVCAWLDLSGGTTVLTNSTPPARPTWQTTGIDGQAAVQFGTTEQVMTTAGVLGIGATSPRTLIAVERLTSGNGRFNPIMQGQGGTPGTYISIDANTWQTAGSLEGVYVTNNSFDTALATSTTATRVHVLTVGATMTVGASLTGAVDYRVNGQVQTLSKRAGSGNFESFADANFTAVGVFGTPSTGGTVTGGLVAEVLVYGRALSVNERQAVEAALKTRYAIP
jgi:hypothetical protein